jgi:hypothetical protein
MKKYQISKQDKTNIEKAIKRQEWIPKTHQKNGIDNSIIFTYILLNFDIWIDSKIYNVIAFVYYFLEISQDEFFQLLTKERIRQNELHPDNSKVQFPQWVLIILEELGEFVIEYNAGNKIPAEIEAIEFAAVLLRFLEDRRAVEKQEKVAKANHTPHFLKGGRGDFAVDRGYKELL